jgi:hypothetical protein
MKNLFHPCLIACLFIFALSCSNGRTFEKMAEELCTCMKPLADLQKEVEALAKEGKTDEIPLLFSKMEKMSAQGDECVQNLEEKYGVVTGPEEEEANAAFKKACPEIAAMLARE